MEEISLDSFDTLQHIESKVPVHTVSLRDDFASTILNTKQVASNKSNCRVFSSDIPNP